MKLLFAALALALGCGTAQGQKVYKHVDDKGNITYSQTPPANDAKTVRVPAPRNSSNHPSNAYLNEEERRAERRARMDEQQRDYERRHQEQQEAIKEARRKHVETLRSECERNRGTDCNDPATIARMEAERGPSPYRPRAR